MAEFNLLSVVLLVVDAFGVDAFAPWGFGFLFQPSDCIARESNRSLAYARV